MQPPPPGGTLGADREVKTTREVADLTQVPSGKEQIEVPAVGAAGPIRACMKQAEDPKGPPLWALGSKGHVHREVPSSEVPQQPLQPPRPPPPANDSRINLTLESTVQCSRRRRRRRQRQTNQRNLANDKEQRGEGAAAAAAAAAERVGAKQEFNAASNVRSPRPKLHKYVVQERKRRKIPSQRAEEEFKPSKRKRCPFLPQNHGAPKNTSVFANKTTVPSKICPFLPQNHGALNNMSVFAKKTTVSREPNSQRAEGGEIEDAAAAAAATIPAGTPKYPASCTTHREMPTSQRAEGGEMPIKFPGVMSMKFPGEPTSQRAEEELPMEFPGEPTSQRAEGVMSATVFPKKPGNWPPATVFSKKLDSRPDKPGEKKNPQARGWWTRVRKRKWPPWVWSVRAFQTPMRPCSKQVGTPGTPLRFWGHKSQLKKAASPSISIPKRPPSRKIPGKRPPSRNIPSAAHWQPSRIPKTGQPSRIPKNGQPSRIPKMVPLKKGRLYQNPSQEGNLLNPRIGHLHLHLSQRQHLHQHLQILGRKKEEEGRNDMKMHPCVHEGKMHQSVHEGKTHPSVHGTYTWPPDTYTWHLHLAPRHLHLNPSRRKKIGGKT